jgi:hypothetical protein
MSEGLATRGYTSDQTGGAGPVPPPAPVLTPGNDILTLVWGVPVLLTVVGAAIANWVIHNITGDPCSVLTVTQTNPNTVVLTTTGQTNGASYSLDLAAGAVQTDPLGVPNNFVNLPFAGMDMPPSLVSAVPQTSISVLATFSEPVVAAEALVWSNYTFDNGLVSVSVTQVSTTQYLVTTSQMHPTTIYTMTVSGIHDLAGNPVT